MEYIKFDYERIARELNCTVSQVIIKYKKNYKSLLKLANKITIGKCYGGMTKEYWTAKASEYKIRAGL